MAKLTKQEKVIRFWEKTSKGPKTTKVLKQESLEKQERKRKRDEESQKKNIKKRRENWELKQREDQEKSHRKAKKEELVSKDLKQATEERNKQLRMIECKLCNKIFKEIIQLNRHYLISHPWTKPHLRKCRCNCNEIFLKVRMLRY